MSFHQWVGKIRNGDEPNGWFRTLAGATTLWCAANASVHADIGFGVVGGPIDLSANVSEAIVPGGTVFKNSSPLFGTEPDRKESAELHAKRSGPFELADCDLDFLYQKQNRYVVRSQANKN